MNIADLDTLNDELQISVEEFLSEALKHVNESSVETSIKEKAIALVHEMHVDHHAAQTCCPEEFGDLCIEFAGDEE